MSTQLKQTQKTLIMDDPSVNCNGEIQWFSEPYFECEDTRGIFKHRNCIRVTYKGQMLISVFTFCR